MSWHQSLTKKANVMVLPRTTSSTLPLSRLLKSFLVSHKKLELYMPNDGQLIGTKDRQTILPFLATTHMCPFQHQGNRWIIDRNHFLGIKCLDVCKFTLQSHIKKTVKFCWKGNSTAILSYKQYKKQTKSFLIKTCGGVCACVYACINMCVLCVHVCVCFVYMCAYLSIAENLGYWRGKQAAIMQPCKSFPSKTQISIKCCLCLTFYGEYSGLAIRSRAAEAPFILFQSSAADSSHLGGQQYTCDIALPQDIKS